MNKSMATVFCTLVPYICWFLVWKLFHINIPALKILRCLFFLNSGVPDLHYVKQNAKFLNKEVTVGV
jgi:hypothetical protein